MQVPPTTIEIPWSAISIVAGGLLSILGAVLLVMVRLLVKSYQKGQDQAFKALKQEVSATAQNSGQRHEDFRAQAEQRFDDFKEQMEARFQDSVEDVVKLDKRLGGYFKAYDRLRDKWDDFLREYLKIDSTRGVKVEALFRITDQMQDTLKELRPALNSKVEEMISHTISELKLYIRDKIQEELRKEAADA